MGAARGSPAGPVDIANLAEGPRVRRAAASAAERPRDHHLLDLSKALWKIVYGDPSDVIARTYVPTSRRSMPQLVASKTLQRRGRRPTAAGRGGCRSVVPSAETDARAAPFSRCLRRPVPWTKERIVGALRAWTRETGEPPRSYEWSPATARSLGRYNDRAARWEREWPRWPGADTLRYRFGRFTEALEEAGLPARPLAFEFSLPERVEAAQRLAAAGEPTRVIADHLGVHPATARSYVRARSCRDCGTAVVSGARALPALRARAPAKQGVDARGDRRGGACMDRRDGGSADYVGLGLRRARCPEMAAGTGPLAIGAAGPLALRQLGGRHAAAGHRARWRTYTREEMIEALRREAGGSTGLPPSASGRPAPQSAPTRPAWRAPSGPGPPGC
jgi:hypothetical protein